MIVNAARRLAVALVRSATFFLPDELKCWAHAMRHEVEAIDAPGEAILFAGGCLGFAIRHVIVIRIAKAGESTTMNETLLHHPRRLVAVCAVAATGLGLAYMAAADAPMRYLALNAVALLLGFVIAGIVALLVRTRQITGGGTALALGLALLLTSLLGVSVDGARRWLAAGPVFVQPGLMILPVLAILFARHRGSMATISILIAAVSLAIQPDRAMSGALTAGLAVLALLRREPNVLAALAVSIVGFVSTLIQPDLQAAMPYVDQIFFSSFVVHPLAGAAVVAGALLLVVPPLAGLIVDRDNRETHAVFGAVWLAILVAAALGNYPTPLVGFGASAIIGYVVSLTGLPKGGARAGAGNAAASAVREEMAPPHGLREGLPHPA